MKIVMLLSLGLCAFALSSCSFVSNKPNGEGVVTEKNARPPNIIVFYADDLGYGDVSSYGASQISTPNVDVLANSGIKFMDAHSSAATCTPSRYSLLTGEYGFRKNAKILTGDAPALIGADTFTLPALLKKAGYKTAVIGKWHLGLGDGGVNWNETVSPGPREIGFDYSFLIPATGDRVPTVYLENQKVLNLNSNDPIYVDYETEIGNRPIGYKTQVTLRYQADIQHSATVINGVSRIGYMKGGKSAEWIDEDFHEVFTQKAKAFIRENKDEPFFVYFPFHDPHVPRLPHPRFQGATKMGPRGDAIVQMDWMTGSVMGEVAALGLTEDTLVVFTSDNGPVLNDGYDDQAVELLGNHKPAGPLRGGKYSAFEGGSRVPTIVSWPGTIQAGESSALVSQVDFVASFAALTGQTLPNTVAIDSRDMMAQFLGLKPKGRETLLKQSIPAMTLRMGDFKYIAAVENLATAGTFIKNDKNIESGASEEPQLYNLSNDLAEMKNLAERHPDLAHEMNLKLEEIQEQILAER